MDAAWSPRRSSHHHSYTCHNCAGETTSKGIKVNNTDQPTNHAEKRHFCGYSSAKTAAKMPKILMNADAATAPAACHALPRSSATKVHNINPAVRPLLWLFCMEVMSSVNTNQAMKTR